MINKYIYYHNQETYIQASFLYDVNINVILNFKYYYKLYRRRYLDILVNCICIFYYSNDYVLCGMLTSCFDGKILGIVYIGIFCRRNELVCVFLTLSVFQSIRYNLVVGMCIFVFEFFWVQIHLCVILNDFLDQI